MRRRLITNLAFAVVLATTAVATQVHATGCDWVIVDYYWSEDTQSWEPVWEYQCWEDPPPPDPP
ncbi:MAG: hypothetical protein ACRDFW_07625, partial [bacterium]